MPTGWTAQGSGGGGTPTGCNLKEAVGNQELAKASADYGDPSGVPQWSEDLDAEPPATAESVMTKLLSVANACHSLTVPASSGQPAITLTAAKISFPAVGDQSGAYAFTGTVQSFNFVIYIVLARFGTVVGSMGYENLGSDVSDFQALVDKASAKIKANTSGTSPTTTTTTAAASGIGSSLKVGGEKGTAEVTLVAIIDPAKDSDEGTPDKGTRFVGVKLSYKALSAYSDDADASLAIIGSDGQTYTAEGGDIVGCTDFDSGQVTITAAGSVSVGCVEFQLPKAVKAATVQYSAEGGLGTTVQWNV